MKYLPALAAVTLLAGMGIDDQAAATAPAPASPQVPPAMLFVADGSGDSCILIDSLISIIRCRSLPWGLEPIRWSRNLGAIIDHSDIKNHRRWGLHLAGRVAAFRQANPTAKVYVFGYSSGSHVALIGAENAPPGSIDRVILLAPSVSCFYDLRPALRTCREGIDCFYSTEDGILDLAIDHYGSADGKKIIAAGQVGFRTPRPPFPGEELYSHLRQFPWSVGVENTGHHGGHMGYAQPAFLTSYVLPIMITPWTPPASTMFRGAPPTQNAPGKQSK